MKLALHLHRWATMRGALAISTVVGAFFAFSTLYAVSVAPPDVRPRQVSISAAATHVVLDAPRSLVGATAAAGFDHEGLSKRAELYGNLIASPPVHDRVARRVGVPPDRLATRTRLTLDVQWAMRDPDAERRANQLLSADRPYKLEVQANPVRPVLSIYAQAPSTAAAERLADAAVAGLREYLSARARREGFDRSEGVVISQLGRARGSVINGQTTPQIVLLVFLVAFGVSLGLLVGIARVWRGWEAAAGGTEADDATGALPAAEQSVVRQGGDWPHTTRVMPWMIAGFMVILWLVPFNVIELGVSLPFDLKFDRMVLPLLFGLWLLALAAGGPAAPRLRLTLIHVGLAVFVGVASLSVAFNALDLNQTLEFDLAFKKLTLLLSFALLFVIVASSVRRSEVPAFLKFMLILAVVTSAGVICEYRFHYNVFYDLSSKLLPGIFSVGAASVSARDDIGRVMTFGPTDHPLEVAGMLTMALPIALVGILSSKERRSRALYAIAACVLLAAAISTYRKTALLGPVSVVLVIAYFRRRELLRLAPLGFLAVGAIHALSPGALGSTLVQLHPDRLGVATVSDRAADYDAVRPDVWSHLAFGRGYGSYDHVSYRILDSEMLNRLVDTGILGVLAMVFMFVCIVIATRRMIDARDPDGSPEALAVAASAVAFLVLTFLFDVSSFPHVPYILLSLAGLAAVVVSGHPGQAPPPAVQRVKPPTAARRRPALRPRQQPVSR